MHACATRFVTVVFLKNFLDLNTASKHKCAACDMKIVNANLTPLVLFLTFVFPSLCANLVRRRRGEDFIKKKGRG